MSKTYTYSQSKGTLVDDTGVQIAQGWAGNHAGKNNPAMQNVHDIGPLPQGLYTVGPWEDHHDHLGPFVAALMQIEGETFGRSAFFIHGPSMDPSTYGQESKGCIVIPRPDRLKVRAYAPDHIRVVA